MKDYASPCILTTCLQILIYCLIYAIGAMEKQERSETTEYQNLVSYLQKLLLKKTQGEYKSIIDQTTA